MKKFYVLRHGQTVANTEHRLQGQTDTHLNEVGISQAKLAGTFLAETKIVPDVIIVSPLTRVKETAEYATGKERSSFEVDPRIIEMGFGVLEMLRTDHMTPEFYEEFHHRTDIYHAPEGGETFYELIARVGSFIETMRAREDHGETILVVSHGAAIHALINYIDQEAITKFWDIHVGNCAILEVHLGDRREDGEDSWTFLHEGFHANATLKDK
ncbi:MAG: histidine phosphatase family protein [Lachnospiraceae bacterium]|nr:histidine phosphatase family protein [Lachnospiraceae bacterium]